MTRRTIFHRFAQHDTTKAFLHYENERTGLGILFLTELARCLGSIARVPESGRRIAESRRRRLLKRFPYAVIYRLSEHEIRVLAIAHLSRRPNFWVDRD